MKILYVEDNAMLRRAFARMMSVHGITVLLAASADEALGVLDHTTVNAIVADMQLDSMRVGGSASRDGDALIAELRRQGGPVAELPMLLISGSLTVHARGQAVGATVTLDKPVSSSDVLRALGWASATPEGG